jgi:hypothetical protein
MGIIDFFGGLFIGVVLFLIMFFAFILIGSLQRKLPTSTRFKKILRSISFVFVLLTPFIVPIRVGEKSQFEMLNFGFPFAFVEQHTNSVVMNRDFPFFATLANPWGHSIMGNLNIRIDLFIFSVVSVYFILYMLVYLGKKLRLIKGND